MNAVSESPDGTSAAGSPTTAPGTPGTFAAHAVHAGRAPHAVHATEIARCVQATGARAALLGSRLPVAALGSFEALVGSALAPWRDDIGRSVRRSLGVPSQPPRRVADPGEAFLPPGGVARRVHGDLGPMVVGGLAALLLQTLHPLAMAGVADHSNYKEDAVGRLRRTAHFVGVTTFGGVDDARAAIDEVRRVHRHVRGVSPDGRAYSADDPDLLTWVHVAEMWSFLEASQRYGRRRLSPADCDRYFAETAVVALALGARWAPRSVDQAKAYFRRVRPDLYAGPQAMAARDFLLRGVGTRPGDRVLYGLIVAAAVPLLPRWARSELQIPRLPLVDALMVAPAARSFCTAVRWAVAPSAKTAPAGSGQAEPTGRARRSPTPSART